MAGSHPLGLVQPATRAGKVTQRVAVRIAIPAKVAAEHLLRPGMSVVVSIDSRANPAKVADFGDKDLLKEYSAASFLIDEAITLRREDRCRARRRLRGLILIPIMRALQEELL